MNIVVKFRCIVLLLVVSGPLCAQQFNSVPLDNTAYDIIEMGIIRGMIAPPVSARPWTEAVIKEKLSEMAADPLGKLSSKELDIVAGALSFFDRKTGIDYSGGRYRTENGGSLAFETGLGWESVFAVAAPGAPLSSVNMAKVYCAGDFGSFFSWNINLRGGFLYIDRVELGKYRQPDNVFSPVYEVPSSFFYSFTRQWDGGVLLPSSPADYHSWPGSFAFGWGAVGEINAAFFDEQVQLRIGRIRRDWGTAANGASLALNAQGRPFTAIEGTAAPFSWLGFSFLAGALESFDGADQWPQAGIFKNGYSLAQIEIKPWNFFYFDAGGAAIWPQSPNLAFFTSLELRLPGILKIWGSAFVDTIESLANNFSILDGNAYAYQVGLKSSISWLSLAAVTMRYTKVEPYCYTQAGGADNVISPNGAYTSGGESLGYYLPPNSDEFLVRLESLFSPALKAHMQFQMLRHGVDYGYGAVDGSSLRDNIEHGNSTKYFLKDGVYRWNTVLKIGGTFRLHAGEVPLSIYSEAGMVSTRFTINGSAGVGSEADYEGLNDDVYRASTGFVFSIGFRVYP